MKKFFKKDSDSKSINHEKTTSINIPKPDTTQTTTKIKDNKTKKEFKMGNRNVTTLTPDVEIKGSIKFNEVLEMNGKFEGELHTTGGEIVVGPTGEVKANFKVKNAIIKGRVEGNVTAEDKIELKNNAKLIGDLNAKTLSIEEGVHFVGKCNVNPNGIKIDKPISKESKK